MDMPPLLELQTRAEAVVVAQITEIRAQVAPAS
jgi:hypothetical protein